MYIEKIWTVYRPKWTDGTYAAFIAAALVVAAVLYVASKRMHWKKSRVFSGYALVIYLIFVYASTVFTRPDGARRYEMELFWTYRRGMAGDREVLEYAFLNCLLLTPVGALLPVILKKKSGKSCFRILLLIGFLISLSIELLQLALKKGLFEFDDMIHNVVSVALGYAIYAASSCLYKKIVRP